MKVVIVGGVAGGATAAARIRRLDEKAEIIIFEKSNYVSYANCGLPYYIGGVITEKEELTLHTPESFRYRFCIDVKVRHEVMKIDPEGKKVLVKNLETEEEFEETYDKLVLSPGAKPVMPQNMECQKGVFSLRTVEDTYKIYDYIEENKPENVVIAGGGFIGIELAENLCDRGIEVSIVQRGDHLLAQLDYEMAAFLHQTMRKKKIRLRLKDEIKSIEKVGNKIKVSMKEEVSETDMVILAMGVVPDSFLAKEAGLELGKKGSILVNERMETSKKDIYAVGDAVEVKHFVTGEKDVIPLAGPANKQGRIAADNICGVNSIYKGSQGSSIIKAFDMTIGVTGINEARAKAAGIKYDKVYLSPMSHAGYYPGGSLMTIKVIYEKDTYRLLGAQILGRDGVDKRIDVLAASIRGGISALELKDLDLSYAPPYSSAKDPVNMAGYMIENVSEGRVKQYFWDEINHIPFDGSVTLLDTRTVGETARGMVEGYINIPVDELRERMGELEKGKPVYVMCQSGLRSYIACRILMQSGYECYNFAGGYRLYSTVFLEKEMAKKALPCGKDEQSV